MHEQQQQEASSYAELKYRCENEPAKFCSDIFTHPGFNDLARKCSFKARFELDYQTTQRTVASIIHKDSLCTK